MFGSKFYILPVLTIGVFLLTTMSIGAAPETVHLRNAMWKVDIVPHSLAVEARLVDAETVVPISSAQPGFGDVSEFAQDGKTISWRIADRFLTVRFELINESLSVEFVHDQQTRDTIRLTWPVIEDSESLRAYILPLFEGSYVPKDDIIWQDFLSDRGSINTTAGLSMPFWGLDLTDRTLTYILTNPFNNRIRFNKTAAPSLGMAVSHAFTPNWEQKRYGLRISLGAASPVAPAKQYRQWLKQNAEFVSFAEKIEKTPAAAKLLGAAHVYVWGGKLLSEHDVTDWKAFATRLTGDTRIWTQLNAETREVIQEIAQSEYPSKYARRVVSRAISAQLEKRDFYKPSLWTDIPLTSETEKLISRAAPTLSLPELYRRNCLLFYAAFSDLLRHPDVWGDGLSVKLLEQFAKNGLDRLWLGVDSWQDGFRHPTAVAKAKELGYLVGPYDSYHSIHHPNETDTWETAQFDLSLYETGGIVNADGTKSRGFKKKGYHLSPLVAQPYVENRVNGIVTQMSSDFNTWFIDCDAYGELFDDYSTSHPATQLDDMNARLARIAWIRDTYNMVVGSEGGAAYSAATLHFAHGMTLPVIGWGDPDMKSKTSPHYVGGYWPPEGPAIHIKQVPLKPNYLYHYYDPRFRVPLYQIVFHDSVITTHHWGSGSLKFENAIGTLALLELLYNVPPLYHLNIEEFSKHKAWIKRHYAFFSPLHRQIGGQAMTDFQWLTDDRLVQRTEFGDTVEILANFGENPFRYKGVIVMGKSVVARWLETDQIKVFSLQP